LLGTSTGRVFQGAEYIINQGASTNGAISPRGFLYGMYSVSGGSDIDRRIVAFAQDSLPKINLHDDLKAKQIYLEYQLRRLDQLIAQQKTPEAIALCDEVYNWGKDINDPHTCLSVAQYFRNRNTTDQSLLWVELAQKAMPSSYERRDIYVNLGIIYRQRGDIPAALEALNRALEIDPDYLPAKYNLNLVKAEAALKQQDWPLALTFFKTLCGLEPENSLLYFNMAVIYGKIAGHEQDAIGCYEKFIQLDNDQHQEAIRQAQEQVATLRKAKD